MKPRVVLVGTGMRFICTVWGWLKNLQFSEIIMEQDIFYLAYFHGEKFINKYVVEITDESDTNSLCCYTPHCAFAAGDFHDSHKTTSIISKSGQVDTRIH